MKPRAFLFDLDDTLYDHTFSCLQGLKVLSRQYPALRGVPSEQLEREYSAHMERLPLMTLRGALPKEVARMERVRLLFREHGEDISRAEARRRAATYRAACLRSQRAVPGAIQVVRNLAKRGHPIAVVTNNAVRGQRQRLEEIGAAPYVDSLVISGALGFSKPDPRIFQTALQRLDVDASQCTMVGDSWRNDVEGANGVGIRAIWFNRRNELLPLGQRAPVLSSYEPLNEALRVILAD
ncbi:MAG: HAD family hydrolase [Thermoplasmata archaeon]